MILHLQAKWSSLCSNNIIWDQLKHVEISNKTITLRKLWNRNLKIRDIEMNPKIILMGTMNYLRRHQKSTLPKSQFIQLGLSHHDLYLYLALLVLIGKYGPIASKTVMQTQSYTVTYFKIHPYVEKSWQRQEASHRQTFIHWVNIIHLLKNKTSLDSVCKLIILMYQIICYTCQLLAWVKIIFTNILNLCSFESV